MINEFNKFISDNSLANPGDKILLAVSGGIDSMVMAYLFHQQGYTIGVAHCNFTLRAVDSDKDEEIVRQFAEKHNIPFYTRRFETKAFAKKNRISVQMAARELRYKWFEEIRTENMYDYIAIAHNLNDNIETLLINLIRGTGLAGMAGMKPSVNRIIRPLLFATRRDILSFRDQNNIDFREDSSIEGFISLSRGITICLILFLIYLVSAFELSSLNETAERFSGLNEIVTGHISRLREKISEENDQLIVYNINQLKKHLHNKAVVFELFKPYGLTSAILTDLLKIIEGKTGGQVITDTHRIIKDRNEIIVSAGVIRDEKTYAINGIDDFSLFPGISSAKKIRINDSYEIPDEPSVACVDFQKVDFPMIIRKWKAGDHFYPLGMNRKKKLSDYFIDEKYSKFDKENIFILESGGKIVWIIGDRIDDRFKITDSTKKGLLIKSKRKALIIKPVK